MFPEHHRGGLFGFKFRCPANKLVDRDVLVQLVRFAAHLIEPDLSGATKVIFNGRATKFKSLDREL